MTALLPLTGVSWTTASALLHFAHPRPFPILAVGRLLSLNYLPGTRFTLSLWLAYVHTCRTLAEESQTSLRELDRALWQFTQEHKLTTHK